MASTGLKQKLSVTLGLGRIAQVHVLYSFLLASQETPIENLMQMGETLEQMETSEESAPAKDNKQEAIQLFKEWVRDQNGSSCIISIFQTWHETWHETWPAQRDSKFAVMHASSQLGSPGSGSIVIRAK